MIHAAWSRRAFAGIVAALLAGCASQTLSRRELKAYHVGDTLNAPPGGVFFYVQNGSIETVKRWVGILNSPDGWQVESRQSADFVRKELLYTGVSGTAIELMYREFRGGLAAPAFFQALKYDLKDSKRITFQTYTFEVIAATNEALTARLVQER